MRDRTFLWQMLHEAAYWRPDGPRPSMAAMRRDDVISRYLDDWGRPGDIGVIAHERQRLGAAWARLFTDERHGWAYLGPTVPELVIGVRPECRGMGVGSALLEGLIAAANAEGFRTLSLGVETDSPALRLYERQGFVRVRLESGVWIMRRDSARI